MPVKRATSTVTAASEGWIGFSSQAKRFHGSLFVVSIKPSFE
jgi:hypothetical protein